MSGLSPEEVQALVETVLVVGAMFSGIVFSLMEGVVKPLTEGTKLPDAKDERARKTARGKLRKAISAALSVVLPSVYLAYTQQVPWGALPVVIVMSYAAATVVHKKRKKNDDAP